ncbi:glycosyltransferase [Algoriphagus sp.]|uniref:glycosyltransferase n=1 Tax=Algoriphagus sp. TaxID=1872435 RepID=UPI003F6E5E1F
MNRIAIVTPLKNEIDNISFLIDKISSQSIPISYWIIVENGSVDGSRERLAEISEIKNVENFVVLNFSLPNEKYELGIKYATVVNQGFNYLKNQGILDNLDYVGILDADCFPPPNYYEELTTFMSSDSKIGISSGLAYSLDGVYDGKSRDWVRGNCRLWKISCFKQAGYFVGPSADALSVCKAELLGWTSKPKHDLKYECREVGNKVNYSYYGYSAYFRGISPLYALIKSFNYARLGQFSNFKGYFSGYFGSYFGGKERIEDKEIKLYFSNYLSKKIFK